MSDEVKEIRQDSRVYRFTCTEKVEISGNIWTRDRYQNADGNPHSFLLVNFINTGVSANQRMQPIYQPEPEPAPKPKREPVDYRKYIQEWKARGLVK